MKYFCDHFLGSSLEKSFKPIYRNSTKNSASLHLDSPSVNIVHLGLFPCLLGMIQAIYLSTCHLFLTWCSIVHNTTVVICSKQGHFLTHCHITLPIRKSILIQCPIHRLYLNFKLFQQHLPFPFWSGTRAAVRCPVPRASAFNLEQLLIPSCLLHAWPVLKYLGHSFCRMTFNLARTLLLHDHTHAVHAEHNYHHNNAMSSCPHWACESWSPGQAGICQPGVCYPPISCFLINLSTH